MTVGTPTGSAGATFTAAVTVDDGAGPKDLLVRLVGDDDVPVKGDDLYRLLRRASGVEPPLLTVERTGEALARDVSLSEAGLISGDRLSAVPSRRAVGSDTPGDQILLQLLTGPQTGSVLALPPGVEVGRATAAGLDDPSVSRRHFRLGLVDAAVTVEDRGAVNTTVINGQRTTPRVPVEVAPGDVIEVGRVLLRVVSGPPVERNIRHRAFNQVNGALEFQQAPRAIELEPVVPAPPPEPPPEPPERRFPLAAAVVPLVLGAVMALVLEPVYALFILFGPLMVVWTFLDDRRSGRRQYDRHLAAYRRSAADYRLAVDDHLDQRAAWQRRRCPSLTQVGRFVRIGSAELWARQPDHDDFLTVAVGQLDVAVEAPAVPGYAAGLGDDELSAPIPEPVYESQVEPSAHVAVDLADTPVLGITGDIRQASAVAASVVAQLVGLRSPRHLRLCVLAPEHEAEWGWTTWLPHVHDDGWLGDRTNEVSKSGHDSDGVRPICVAGSDDQARTLLARLEALVENRRRRSEQRLGADGHGPHVVVVIHPPVGLAPSSVSSFLASAPGHGFSVLNLAADRVQLSAEVDVLIEARRREESQRSNHGSDPDPYRLDVTTMATSHSERSIKPWRLNPTQAETLARDLAPLVDVNAAAGAVDLPPSVGFQETTGRRLVSPPAGVDSEPPPPEVLTSERLAARWMAQRPGLQAVLGVAVDGPVTLDLKSQGPHALVAGTTGSGKSEFLQSLLVSLAFNHSPTQVNFILIDYKGGAAFRQCRLLPHTVGFVTDLDDHLAERALVSLRAELRRREEVLATAGVGDLEQMAAVYGTGAKAHLVPPSLVVVVDEFAALKAEVPDFVDGLVDVAQRGRSLGVHMILATQKPAGVITPQIEANTNIRVALRVANDHESSDIIGVTDAARIDNSTPGQAYLKVGGGGRPTCFQSTFVGGPARQSVSRKPGLWALGYGTVVAVELDVGNEPDDAVGRESPELEASELDAFVTLARQAWPAVRGASGHRLHRPWLAPLPSIVALPELVANEPEPTKPVIGLVDSPSRQSQAPMRLDLDAIGHAVVFGATGSGKSTLIRSVACSATAAAALTGRPGPDIIVVEAGRSLTDLADLPLVSDVVSADDPELVPLVVEHLQAEVDRRRDATSDRPLLVLIDGLATFWSTLQSVAFGRPADTFARLLADMPGVGVHAFMTADQRSSVPHQCLGSVGLRLVQRMSSVDQYRAADVGSPPPPASMVPGRTFVVGAGTEPLELQVGVAVFDGEGSEPAASSVSIADQRNVVAGLAADAGAMLTAAGVEPRSPAIVALPSTVTVDHLASVSGADTAASLDAVAVGLGPGHRPVKVNLADTASLLVVGPAQSGRSSALATIAARTSGLVAEHRVVAVKRSSPLAQASGAVTAEFAATFTAWAEESAERAARRVDGQDVTPIMILVDDADELFEDTAVAAPLTDLVLNGRDGAVIVVASATVFRTVQAYDTWIRALRSSGRGIVLQPDGDRDEDVFDCRFPRGVPTVFPPGRGYVVDRAGLALVQLAVTSSIASSGSVAG